MGTVLPEPTSSPHVEPPSDPETTTDDKPIALPDPTENMEEIIPLPDMMEADTEERSPAVSAVREDYSTGLPIDTWSTWESDIPGYNYSISWLGGAWTDKTGTYHPANDTGDVSFYTSVGGTGAGEACFCIEHGEMTWRSVAATRPLSEIAGVEKAREMSLAAYFGYYSNKSVETRVFTQYYIWEVYPTNSAGFDNRCAITPDDPAVATRYQLFKRELTEQIAKSKLVPNFAAETIPVIGTRTTTITDTNGVLAYFMKANEWVAGTPHSQDGFTVSWDGGNSLAIQAEPPANVTQITLSNILAKYRVSPSSLVTPTHYAGQYTMTYGVGEPTTFTLSLERLPGSGRFHIKKTDELGQGLAGAAFSLTAPDGSVSTIHMESETYSSPDLTPGHYTLVETNAPEGYLLDQTARTITIEEGTVNQVYVHEAIVNKAPVGIVRVEKRDGVSDAPVAGAVFDVLDALGTGVDTITTGADGRAESSPLPLGDYHLAERHVPAPYRLATAPTPFTLAYVDQHTPVVICEVRVVNDRAQGRIQIQKQDAIDARPIAGVFFDILDSQNLVVSTLETDVHGLAETPLLPLGEYVAVEKQPAEGYQKNTKNTPITLSYQDMHTPVVTAKAIVDNDPISGRIQVVKVEDDQETPIAGAVFQVFDRKTGDVALGLQNEPVGALTTDANGFAFTPLLRHGDYYLIEQDAPKQYLLNQHAYDVSIREHDKTEVIYIANRFVELRLKITKMDAETKEPLADVAFQVLDEAGDVVTFQYLNDAQQIVEQTHLITNQDGVAFTRGFLRAGEYRVVETKTPDGYLPVAAKHISISRDTSFIDLEFFGATTELVIGNAPTKVFVSKKSITDEDELPGARLQVFEARSGAVVDEWISEPEPHLIERLKAGETYILRETIAPLGYALASDVTFTVTETDDVQPVEMRDELTGLEIRKLDSETKEPLEQVRFQLTNADGEVIAVREEGGTYVYDPSAETSVLKTNAQGVIRIHGLPVGDYLITEEAFVGYITAAPVSCHIGAADSVSQPRTVTIENKPVIVTLTKSDLVTGKPVPGATIRIETEEGELVEEAITDNDGHIILTRLTPGVYRFRETAEPRGYVLNEDTFTFTVSPDGDVSGVTSFTNEPTALQLEKTDNDTGEALEGIVFRLHLPDGEQPVRFALEDGLYLADANGAYTDLSTDKDGKIRLRYLSQGNYLLKEIRADGFRLMEEPITVTIDDSSGVLHPKAMPITNDAIVVTLRKEDLTDSAPVPGATIEIADKANQLVQRAVTDEKGEVTLTRLPAGEYTFREVLAPEGYLLNPDTFTFTVDEQGDVTGTTTFNDEPTELRLYKSVKDSDKPIGGVSFQLTFPDKTVLRFRLENGVYIVSKTGDLDQLTTNQDGLIVVRTLPIGTYHLRETKAADGFVLDESVYEIKLEAKHGVNNPLQIGLTNRRITTETTLPKTGEATPWAWYLGSGLLAGGLLLLITKLRRRFHH
ncbi:MAG TPA: LPXTG cell wall anchor domain-containing protein [Clostridiaceae bacterium]|nr:LPXTG cell wall anchor domain-containing protein [Clostridiaceae bacterium]